VGTYADNRSVVVSATGTGEIFIRTVAAFNTAAQYGCCTLPSPMAADNTLMEIAAIGRAGGLIMMQKAIMQRVSILGAVPGHYRQRRHSTSQHFLMS